MKSLGREAALGYGYKPNVAMVRMYCYGELFIQPFFYNCLPIRIYFVRYYYFVSL